MAPPVPKLELAAFMARFSQTKIPQREFAREALTESLGNAQRGPGSDSRGVNCLQNGELKPASRHCLEGAQAQDLGLDRGREEDMEWELIAISDSSPVGTQATAAPLSSPSDPKKPDSGCLPAGNRHASSQP